MNCIVFIESIGVDGTDIACPIIVVLKLQNGVLTIPGKMVVLLMS